MKSMKLKFAILVLIVGLLSACVAQATEAPASEPTEAAATATDAPTQAPAATDTSAPATESPTAAAAASDTPAVAAGGATVSFAGEILPMLQNRCGSCHGGNRTEEGLSLQSYADVIKGSDNGPVVTPGDAVHSLLAEMVISQEMPKRGPKLTPDQVQLIVDWINQGALDN